MSGGPDTGNLERLGAFCDGVFAIAITLLVLDVRVPTAEAVTARGLWGALGERWGSYAAFALSFVIIGIMWANHHNIFRYIRRSNHVFVLLNLGLLLGVAVLPFPTAVLAAYLPVAGARTAATVLYGANLTCTALAFNAVWRYAAGGGGRLLKADADPRLVAYVTREYLLGPVLYAVATVVALLNVGVSLGIHALLAGLFFLPNPSRP
ncbi:MAG TPA: TMEM175 family protein [Gemmatimonadales bacterium]|nr:TMEM175 family protein [Gemmatimonadales bacterium]